MSLVKKGENWFIDYRANGRRIREKIGPSKKLAESVLSKHKSDIAEKRFLNVRRVSTETFRQFSARYLDWARGRLRSAQDEEGLVRQLDRRFGSSRLADIDLAKAEKYMAGRLKERKQHPFRGRAIANMSPDEINRRIEAWYASEPRTVSKARVNREIACLRRILNKAVDWKVIALNSIQRIKLYDEREFIRKRYLKPTEIRSLLAACGPQTRDIVAFGLYIGRRLNELLGMRWQDVDIENGYIYFPDTKKKEPDQVPMPPEVRTILERRKSLNSREFVFCRDDGSRFYDIQTGFDNALRRANIRDFHFHDLRHTAVSYMIMNGIDLKTVAELVGHTTAQMVDKRYGHLSPDHKRTATDVFGSAMDRLCGRAPKPPAQAQP